MYDEDIIFGMDGDLATTMASTTGQYRDEAMEQFYNKLGEYNSNWVDLEWALYKNTKVGTFEFLKKKDGV